MNLEWDDLREVSVEDVENGSIDVEDGSLLLNVGRAGFSPRRTYELIQSLEENGLSASSVEVLRVESPRLGRVDSGSEDLFKRGTALQRQKAEGEDGVWKGLAPDYITVCAPLNECEDREATVRCTVEQLQAAQELINSTDDPANFEGQFVIENRPDSVLTDGDDLELFEEAADDLGFELLYSFDLTAEHGSELMAKGVDGIRLLTERQR